ncbi:AIR synthase related protein [Portibacter lacus]|uniref:Phosphoribosylformylglycinamidine cyclo-ligase n=1 Tax=Portibacter lacus TaxID=1099794 RepID=A0AA37SUK2_9BACT|nr:AIR synthase related protein [Portibacter lacus]GLR18408.1 phosphoribosylformylglycinamidine cyclo-ligase [Portibacter lacus]
MSDDLKYGLRGVSASKDEVHVAIEGLDKGLFDLAFCKILPDFAGNDDAYCNIMHADTAGTKPSLAYAYWKETGDLSVWKGIAQDALIMNLDDMACVGCVDNMIISSTIGRNKNLITGEVITAIIQGTKQLLEEYAELGIHIHHAGGETADVGDIVRTADVGFTAFGRMKRSDLIINDIQEGDVIVAFASDGQCTYEDSYNGGMGSNGLTSARHDVLDKIYRKKYPDTYDANIPESLIYAGSKLLTDTLNIEGEEIPVGKLILSPTRTYIPLIQQFMRYKDQINGMIHCTGGAQTKVLKFIKGKKIVKNNMFETPPLFKMIQAESGTSWKEMYQVFNMGHRLEVYTNKDTALEMIEIGASFNIKGQIIGHVESSEFNEVEIQSQYGTFNYSE